MTEATTSVGRQFGDGWEARAVENPVGTCVTTEGDFDDQSMIPESSGTAEVGVGRVRAAAAPSERGRILRDRFETPWRDLGFDTRYERPSPVAPGGRVVATLDRSQQLVLTGSLADGYWTLVARVACSTVGLPGSFTPGATPAPGPASKTEQPESAPGATAPAQ